VQSLLVLAHKEIEWDENTTVNLQLWDIAGHEVCLIVSWRCLTFFHQRFGCMTHVYFKYAIAAVIVFDLTRPSTYEAVRKVSVSPVFLCLYRLCAVRCSGERILTARLRSRMDSRSRRCSLQTRFVCSRVLRWDSLVLPSLSCGHQSFCVVVSVTTTTPCPSGLPSLH